MPLLFLHKKSKQKNFLEDQAVGMALISDQVVNRAESTAVGMGVFQPKKHSVKLKYFKASRNLRLEIVFLYQIHTKIF
jgi:hypothetical protein